MTGAADVVRVATIGVATGAAWAIRAAGAVACTACTGVR